MTVHDAIEGDDLGCWMPFSPAQPRAQLLRQARGFQGLGAAAEDLDANKPAGVELVEPVERTLDKNATGQHDAVAEGRQRPVA